ncbi:hypothetical protein PRIPAC_84647 [Pristionchus pacificus]|uniref:Uncharacterized protein n=1 Tax=Pristionchus pacificus TaxID=54126 RepID=A0A2A6BNM7_PRIPA|nr:hypothetical protein PRIPAC_84647 [Pristionchus pacificus]|eukprot:PDM67572.1 hypothetical protein PRIPAC_48989 [Pristionchus pacificus]
MAHFEKVEYFGGHLITSLNELCEAIKKRTMLTNKFEWHLFVDCKSYFANDRIREAALHRDFEEAEIDPKKFCKDEHHFLCNGVKILIEYSSGEKPQFSIIVVLFQSGLKQGWVSTTYMSCGASLPIKRWKSRYTDDMMYGENLEWNTWYKGMVQDGGKVQFYMWY